VQQEVTVEIAISVIVGLIIFAAATVAVAWQFRGETHPSKAVPNEEVAKLPDWERQRAA